MKLCILKSGLISFFPPRLQFASLRNVNFSIFVALSHNFPSGDLRIWDIYKLKYSDFIGPPKAPCMAQPYSLLMSFSMV